MIFFPTIYEDELLYNVIGRYHIRSGNMHIYQSIEDIFSNRDLKPNVYLPSNIDAMIENLPLNNTYSAEDIIFKNTLYSFYTSFKSESFSNELLKSMRINNNISTLNLVGIKGMNIKNHIYFRFCPECLKEDLIRYGEAYWHRSHQVVGVLICSKHKVLLEDSSIKINNYNKREYILPNKYNCIPTNEKKYSEDTLEKLYSLSNDIEYILNENLEKKDFEWYRQNYINSLIKMNLATINGTIKMRELSEAFKGYYGEEVLEAIQCSVNYKEIHNWLFNMLRKPRKRTHHPIRHLLLIKFIGYSIDEIINQNIRYMPFGSGPWPCLNKASEHYKEHIITDISTKYYKKQDLLVGTFSCSCGFVYTRRGPDEYCMLMYDISKVKNYGHVWESKLIQLVNNRTFGLRKIAEELNADTKAIDKYAEKLDLDTHWRIKEKNKKERNELKEELQQKKKLEYHKRWIDLKDKYPDKSKTELRELCDYVYFWLYKNDRDWLDENSPNLRISISTNGLVDWNTRDEELLFMIKCIVKHNLESTEKPEKISLSFINRMLDKRLEHYMSRGKIPKTEEYLDEVLENQKSFRIRKVEWAVKDLYNNNEEMTVQKVKKKLNFSKQVIQEFKEIIIQEIDKY